MCQQIAFDYRRIVRIEDHLDLLCKGSIATTKIHKITTKLNEIV